MGLSSSSSKQTTNSTTSTSPYGAAQPGVDQGLSDAYGIYNANQGNAAALGDSLTSAYNSLAPGAFSTNPFVSSAQNAAANVFNSGTNNNPGAATYDSIMGSANPAISSLSSIAGNPVSSSDYSSIGSSNLGAGLLARLSGGGNNSAIPGITNLAYGTGSLGAGDGTLASLADPNSVNPYLDAITQQASNAASKAVNQRFGAAGLGQGLSSAYTGALGSAVANANDTTRYNAYNDAANRALSAASDLSAGSRSDVATRLGALNNLSAADQQKYANQQSTASALASAINSQDQTRLAGLEAGDQSKINAQNSNTATASALGSLFNNQQQTQLAAGQAADSSYNAQMQQILSALGLTSNLADAQYAGVSPLISLATAAASAPYSNVNQYANLVNSLAGKYTTTTGSGTTTTTSSPSLLSVLANAASNGAQAYAAGG